VRGAANRGRSRRSPAGEVHRGETPRAGSGNRPGGRLPLPRARPPVTRTLPFHNAIEMLRGHHVTDPNERRTVMVKCVTAMVLMLAGWLVAVRPQAQMPMNGAGCSF